MVFKAPTKWLLKGPYLYASFRFPAIRFDAPMLLSFSGCTHAHAKCPPVDGKEESEGERLPPFSLPITPCSRRAHYAKTTGDESVKY